MAIPLLDALAHAQIVAALRAVFGGFDRLGTAHLGEKAGVTAAVPLPLVGVSAWLLHAACPRLSRNLLRFGLPCVVLAMPLLPMLTARPRPCAPCLGSAFRGCIAW